MTAPPPVERTPADSKVNASMVSSSISRKRGSPSRSKNSRMEQPRRCSMEWSESTKGICNRRASCRPTVVFPEPGNPTRLTINCETPVRVRVEKNSNSDQRPRALSASILGVMNTSISRLVVDFDLFLNKIPTPGKSPKNGTLTSDSV